MKMNKPKEKAVLAIVGSRNWTNVDPIIKGLERLSPDEFKIISGGAKGVDRIAETHAKKLGYEFEAFLPDWDKYGKSAGMRRNSQLVDAADFLVAFWDGQSRGTLDSINKALKKGILVRINLNGFWLSNVEIFKNES